MIVFVREGKQELVRTKREFVKKAAQVIEKNINESLKKEIDTFRADIKTARENDFGRRIFEAYVGEYMTSHLNESGEVAKLQKEIAALNESLTAKEVEAAEQKQLTESVERKLAAAQDRVNRDKKLNELLGPLSKKDRGVMEELLQTVKTDKLDEGFKKFIPAVLNENTTHKAQKTERTKLKESVRTAKTGNKKGASIAQTEEDQSDLAEISQLKKMAGIQ